MSRTIFIVWRGHINREQREYETTNLSAWSNPNAADIEVRDLERKDEKAGDTSDDYGIDEVEFFE